MYQAPMSLKEIIVNRLRNYFFLHIMQHLKTKILKIKVKHFGQCVSFFSDSYFIGKLRQQIGRVYFFPS